MKGRGRLTSFTVCLLYLLESCTRCIYYLFEIQTKYQKEEEEQKEDGSQI